LKFHDARHPGLDLRAFRHHNTAGNLTLTEQRT
jgi:hypothetical protein